MRARPRAMARLRRPIRPSTPARRFAPLALALTLAAVLGAALADVPGAPQVGATASPTSAPPASPRARAATAAPLEDSSNQQSPTPDIIPEPNSGSRPTRPGDRGGSQQVILFFAICAAIVVLGGLAVLDGRRKKRRAAAAPGDPRPVRARWDRSRTRAGSGR